MFKHLIIKQISKKKLCNLLYNYEVVKGKESFYNQFESEKISKISKFEKYQFLVKFKNKFYWYTFKSEFIAQLLILISLYENIYLKKEIVKIWKHDTVLDFINLLNNHIFVLKDIDTKDTKLTEFYNSLQTIERLKNIKDKVELKHLMKSKKRNLYFNCLKLLLILIFKTKSIYSLNYYEYENKTIMYPLLNEQELIKIYNSIKTETIIVKQLTLNKDNKINTNVYNIFKNQLTKLQWIQFETILKEYQKKNIDFKDYYNDNIGFIRLIDTFQNIKNKVDIELDQQNYEFNNTEKKKNNKSKILKLKKKIKDTKTLISLIDNVFQISVDFIRLFIYTKTSKWDGKINIPVPINLIFMRIYNTLIQDYNEQVLKNLLVIIMDEFISNKVAVLKIITIPKSSQSNLKKNTSWVIDLSKEEITDICSTIIGKDLFKYITINKKPSPWIFVDKNNTQLVYNANSTVNKFLNFISVDYIQSKHIKLFTTQTYVNNINILQNISYTVSIDLFTKIFKQLNFNLLDYFNTISKDIFIYLDPDQYKNYVEKRELSNLNNPKNSKKYSNYFNDLMTELNSYIQDFKDYKTDNFNWKELLKNKLYINDFIIFLFMALYEIDSKIYHFIPIEYRGRLISPGALSFVNNLFFRTFIHLNGSDEIKSNIDYNNNKYYTFYLCSQLKLCDSIDESVVEYSKYINNLNTQEIIEKVKSETRISIVEKINVIKVLTHKENATVSIDASSSLLQILGVLTKNKKLLVNTNVLSDKKEDIYNELIKILKSKYQSDIFYNYYVNRKIVKYVCMTYFYGSSAKYLSQDMKEKFNLKILLVDLIQISNNIINTFKEEYKVIQLAKKLINFYTSFIPPNQDINYKIWDKSLKYSTVRKKKISLSQEEEYENEDQTNLDLNLEKKNKKYKFYISFNISSDEKDVTKRRKSALVNIIHSLDSQICIKTRIALLKKKIKSLSVHDCFIINIKNYEKCLKAYNKQLYKLLSISFRDILIDMNNIKAIVNNNINYSKEEAKYFFIIYNYYKYSLKIIEILNIITNNIKVKSKKKNNIDLNLNTNTDFLLVNDLSIYTKSYLNTLKQTDLEKLYNNLLTDLKNNNLKLNTVNQLLKYKELLSLIIKKTNKNEFEEAIKINLIFDILKKKIENKIHYSNLLNNYDQFLKLLEQKEIYNYNNYLNLITELKKKYDNKYNVFVLLNNYASQEELTSLYNYIITNESGTNYEDFIQFITFNYEFEYLNIIEELENENDLSLNHYENIFNSLYTLQPE